MGQKITTLTLVTLLISLAFTSIQASTTLNSTVIYVDDDNIIGPWDGSEEHPYNCIQKAINSSTQDDTIFVFNGTYTTPLTLNKSIQVIGENPKKTILNGCNTNTIIHITSNNVLLQNFTIKNTSGNPQSSAIQISSHNTTLQNCTLHTCKKAIALYNTSHTKIDNCTLHSTGEAIHLINTDNTTIKSCVFGYNGIAINILRSHNTKLQNNYLHTNGIACYINGSNHVLITHCNISDNSANLGGIILQSSTNITVKDCIINHNGAGISTFTSHDITITQCSLHQNTHFAVAIRKRSQNVRIQQSTILQNYRYAIYVVDNSLSTVTQCTIYDNILYNLYVKQSRCNARNNFWGTLHGPSIINLRSKGKISLNPCNLKTYPFNLRPTKDAGSTWKTNEKYLHRDIQQTTPTTITIKGNDTDNDGVPDWWEDKWSYNALSWDNHSTLDPDNDGLNNIEECYTDKYGSNPFVKDVFVEIDWIAQKTMSSASNKPNTNLIDETKQLFRQRNITLHVDIGELNGGEELPYISNFSYVDLFKMYWNNFLDNDINNPKKGIFHYGIICDYGPDVNFPFMPWTGLDSFLISASFLKKELPNIPRDMLIIGGTVHQLGHSFNLLSDVYTGIDNTETLNPFSLHYWKYKNYKSTMNYRYKYTILEYSDGSHGRGDFNDWDNINLSFFKNTSFF